MKVEAQKLKKFLIEGGIVSEQQFENALEKSKKDKDDLGEILVSEELVGQEELLKIEAYLLGIPFINLEKEAIPLEVLRMIPEPIAKTHNVIAFSKKGDVLEIAMLDPEDLQTIELIEKTNPALKVLSRLTTPDSIKNALAQYQKNLETELGDILIKDIIRQEVKNIKNVSGEDSTAEKLKQAAEEMPIIKIVDTLLKHAILQGASDVHIEPLEKEVSVRYRIDGILRVVMSLPIATAPGIVARIKVLSNLKLDEHRLPQDGRFKVEKENLKYSVRVSVLPVFNGEKIVMRMLTEGTVVTSLEDLGLRSKALEQVKDNLARPAGMILITGPTGSGKTTTLYTMMEMLNTPDVNISTVEDPIEYRMPRINQTQVNSKIGLTFAAGLRVLVRQDPDIIMVGEIRDDETASLAINAALTGHLVLSTLHTTEAAGAIPRLIDMKAEPFLISSTANLIIAQRLVRKFEGEKEKYHLKDSDLKNLSKYCDMDKILEILKRENIVKTKDTMKTIDFYRPKTSQDFDGYKGRIGIYEVLPVDNKIKDMIVKKATTKEIADQAIAEGMITMIEDGFIKAAQGVTSIEEILRVITE